MKRRFSLRTLAQEVFFTLKFFNQNNLMTHASACALGFLFSIFPVIIIAALILIRVLHASPEILEKIFSLPFFPSQITDIPSIVNSFLEIQGGFLFEIILVLFLLWMARHFSKSVINGIQHIFHTHSKRRPIFWNLIVIGLEIITVVVLALIVFIFVAAESLWKTSFVQSLIPEFMKELLEYILKLSPSILLFVFILSMFLIAKDSKTSKSLCFLFALLCTLVFSIFMMLYSSFMDTNRYNLIYGIFSSIIVLLLEVLTFFVLFFFSAQAIFVHQFFDQLLLAELYLLPNKESTNLIDTIRRSMFIKPKYFMKKDSTQVFFPAGSIIYSEGEEEGEIFFVASGLVKLNRKNEVRYCDRGSFFGEMSYILGKPREETAIADLDTKLIKINGETFTIMLEKNPEAAQKVISQISTYFANTNNSV